MYRVADATDLYEFEFVLGPGHTSVTSWPLNEGVKTAEMKAF